LMFLWEDVVEKKKYQLSQRKHTKQRFVFNTLASPRIYIKHCLTYNYILNT
jgi:hypothetical protein